jgi:ribosomal protein S18 acetylase RimI-like enzyme
LSQSPSHSGQLEILDLRHFSAAQLRPLLRDEAERWQRRLHWDYARASNMLLDYLDSRILPGFVALQAGHIVGYAFCVCEGAKAVIGDVYAFGETESRANPICETLLHHLLELVQATPGVDRVESQLLMFPDGALGETFHERGFVSYPRCFMLRDLDAHPSRMDSDPAFVHPGRSLILQAWQPEFYEGTAQLIHRCYANHMDAGINDQYRTLHGAQRFLHNIIRFPGCGVFDPENSWVLRDGAADGDGSGRTPGIEAVLLCSRVRGDVDHITQICITPALRGHGLGQMMLEHCAREAVKRGVRQLSLTVTEANLPARHLYERNGFSTLHRFEAMVRDASGAVAAPQTATSTLNAC